MIKANMKLATHSLPLNRLIDALFLMPIISIKPRIFINGFDISVNRRKAMNHMPYSLRRPNATPNRENKWWPMNAMRLSAFKSDKLLTIVVFSVYVLSCGKTKRPYHAWSSPQWIQAAISWLARASINQRNRACPRSTSHATHLTRQWSHGHRQSPLHWIPFSLFAADKGRHEYAGDDLSAFT